MDDAVGVAGYHKPHIDEYDPRYGKLIEAINKLAAFLEVLSYYIV